MRCRSTRLSAEHLYRDDERSAENRRRGDDRAGLPGWLRPIGVAKRILEPRERLPSPARCSKSALQLNLHVLQLMSASIERVAGLFQFMSDLTELEAKQSNRVAVSSALDQQVGEGRLLLANARDQSVVVEGVV